MKVQEAVAVLVMERDFIENVMEAFGQTVLFTDSHPIGKFVGVIRVAGEKSVALFIKSHQPITYNELVLD